LGREGVAEGRAASRGATHLHFPVREMTQWARDMGGGRRIRRSGVVLRTPRRRRHRVCRERRRRDRQTSQVLLAA